MGKAELGVQPRDRRIDVPVAHLGQAQQAPAHLEIAVQDRQAAVRLRDQGPIDRLGNVRPVHRGGQAARILPRLGGEDVALDLGRQRGAQAGFIDLECAEEGVEHGLALGAVAGGARGGVALAVQPNLLAGHLDLGPGDVRQHELVADLLRPGQSRSARSQQRLAGVVQGVGRLAQGVVQAEAELGQAWVGGDEGIDLRGAHGQHLGAGPGRGFAQLGHHRLGHLAPFLVGGDLQILVALERGVDEQPQRPLGHIGNRLEGGLQRRGALAQPTLEGQDLRQVGLDGLAFGLPGRVAGIEVGQVPDSG